MGLKQHAEYSRIGASKRCSVTTSFDLVIAMNEMWIEFLFEVRVPIAPLATSIGRINPSEHDILVPRIQL